MATLTELLATLDAQGALPRRQVKDIKTAIKHLAAALGHASPETCPVDAAVREEATWLQALETHFATLLETQGRTISAGNRRNVRHHLRTLLRAAEAHGLLTVPLPPRLLTPPPRAEFLRQHLATAPYQTTYRSQAGPRRYVLPQAQWPPDIQAGWRTWWTKRGHRLRDATLRDYVVLLQNYFWYLAHVEERPPTWDDLFDTGLLMGFVHWHAARVGRRSSAHGQAVVRKAAAMAKVLEHPHAFALARLRNEFEVPDEVHIKRNHLVSLAQLEAVAEACLVEGRGPYLTNPRVRFPGARRAIRFQLGVILKLLVRVPLRQRNIREMQLGKHLYQEQTGDWHLHFQGDDLKIRSRGKRLNTYEVNLSEYCDDFLPVLEEWLRDFRPRLPGAASSPFCFLTKSGQPFGTGTALSKELSYVVAMYTGRRFYPHLIRTIWATEYFDEEDKDKEKDYAVAATMLGDTLGVVMKTYYHIDEQAKQAKAATFLRKKLRGKAS
jgi:hypothetical protein